MQIVLHLGVHCTDDGRLVRSLLRSRATLDPLGIHVPGPRRYRSFLRDTLNILNGAPANDEVQAILREGLSDREDAARLVLFHENLICLPQRAISEEGLYPMAARRLHAVRNLFPGAEPDLFMALCNPATLVPLLALRAGPDGYETVLGGADLRRLRWLATVRRILDANPGIRLTLWANEDAALIWPEILRALAGLGPEAAMEGDLDLAAALMAEAGLDALSRDLADHPPADAAERHDRIGAALEAHGRSEEMEIEVRLPGWTEEMVAALTESYIADCAAIAEMEGVTFIAP
jgi:hypothetical protein